LPVARGRSSVGRASPLQGEGQEFESPRLHHLPPTTTRRSRDHPRTTKTSGPRVRAIIEPLIRVLPTLRQATDQRTAGRRRDLRVEPSGGPTSVGPHLNNWIVFGRNEESSISPSSQGNDPDRSQPVTDHLVRGWRGSSYKGHGVDALAPRADEGRGRLRKASGSREQTVIRRCPNGETRLG
jgi:hypothetical protein